MKVLIAVAPAASALADVPSFPLAPPVAYVAPRGIAVAPVVVVRAHYYRRWDRD